MSESRLSLLRRDGGCYSPGPRARVRLSGADRLRYLNGQTSNDLRQLTPGAALPSLVLTTKGKLCAPVLVWTDGDTLVVETVAELGETLLARLERYAIADEVSFALEEAAPVHVFGPAADSLPGLRVHRLGAPGCDVSAPPDGLILATAEEAEILRIERGLPAWGRELTEDTLPQEAALDRTHVNFHKGCYVGQEVVSRLHSVGQVRRQLAGLVGAFAPADAATLVTPAGEPAGTITSAIAHPELGRTAALGYLSTRVSGTVFHVLDKTGACLGEAERSEFPLAS